MSTYDGAQIMSSHVRSRGVEQGQASRSGSNRVSGHDSRHKLTALDCSAQAASSGRGHYGSEFCESSHSSTSEDSMPHGLDRPSPPRSLAKAESPNGECTTADGLGRLSLDHGRGQHTPSQELRGRDVSSASCGLASKRSASSELKRDSHHQSIRPCASSRTIATGRNFKAGQKRGPPNVLSSSGIQARHLDRTKHVPLGQRAHTTMPRDSGYGSTDPLHNSTVACADTQIHGLMPAKTTSQSPHPVARDDHIHQEGSVPTQARVKRRYSGLILQPDSSPISQDQLAAEVKGIYAGLVMVEAKCINIDAAQAADPKSHLGPEQWQALIALHRTLLYEHHDFLMSQATQHPSATSALRGLATKYSMPARMWKHGIHAFLEVLRHRRPDSQDYMLAFIYLAYQMMALLFETVPSFTDTWIECLGDLARYRMAIEEEKEAHATWGGVASRWYTMASDRHPAIGRLYHHLGILERPSLRKFCFYAKSLTCVIPFPNARDSLSTLCGPIVQDGQTIQSSRQSAEARIVTFHALVYTGRDHALIDEVGRDSLDLLLQQPKKLRDLGAYLAVTNVAALFELGAPTNVLWQLYTAAINQAMQSSRSSITTATQTNEILAKMLPSMGSSPSLRPTTDFLIDCFDFVLRHYNSAESAKDGLGFVHIMLAWCHSLHSLRTRLNNTEYHTYDIPFDLRRLSWGVLAGFLNTLASLDPVSAYLLECARQGVFLAAERTEDARPLSEDYTIRGLIWGQFYFCPGWFDGQCEDDGRAMETNSMAKSRIERVLWLGLYLAFHTGHLQYDAHNRVFSASPLGHDTAIAESAHPAAVGSTEVEMEHISQAVAVSPRSRSSGTHSSSSSGSSVDGFHKVKKPRTTRSPQRGTYANVAAAKPVGTTLSRPRKAKKDFNNFRVVDENYAEWSAH